MGKTCFRDRHSEIQKVCLVAVTLACVLLRAKQKPKPQQNQQQKQPHQKRKAISVIQQLGKKYTNLPEEKQQKVKIEIQSLAKDVAYNELEALFGTAMKKAGTRVAVLIALKEHFKNGLERNENIDAFILKAKEDKNDVLVAEANEID